MLAAHPIVMPKQHADGGPEEAPTLNSLPEGVVEAILLHLPQRQRAHAALVCRRWGAIVRTSRLLWQAVALEGLHPASRSLARVESFLAWLIPRSVTVQQLTITERRGDLADPLVLWGNCVGAILLLGPHLRQLTLEWPQQLVVSGWAGALRVLELASFASEALVVREGLCRLTALTELRLKSSKAPLALLPPLAPGAAGAAAAARGAGPGGSAAGGAAGGALPACLVKLRLEGCNLTVLPPAVSALTRLEDLVLSDNLLRDADLQGLSCLVSLRQLTLMGCRMRRVPQSLSTLRKLQVLYLDMGIAGPPEEPIHVQIAAALGPLRRLGILSLGACYLQEFPPALATLSSLRALYLDDNALSSLPPGPYLAGLRVLGIDWRVLLASHAALAAAPRLRKLCLMSVGKEMDAVPRSPEDAQAVVRSLAGHPSLREVLLPQVDGQRCALHLAVLNIVIGLAATPHLKVKAVGYQGIDNEWLGFLEQEEGREGGGEGEMKGPPVKL